MAVRCVIFIDNGVTGSIGVYGTDDCAYMRKPVVEEQGYQKSKKPMKYPDSGALFNIIMTYQEKYGTQDMIVVCERPMINPGRFTASVSGAICFATEREVLRDAGVPYMYCDSRDWQRTMLPSGVKGATELKRASREKGLILFPSLADIIRKQGDADGILGARCFYERMK